ERLYKEGKGLLPARLEGPTDAAVTGLVVENAQQSPLETLGKLAPAALTRLRLGRFMGVSVPGQNAEVRVLARWNNSEASPAVIEKKFGRGRVLLFTVTADKAWSDWPVDATFVLATRSAAMSIAKGTSQQENITAGQPALVTLPEGESAQDPKIRTPGGEIAAMQMLPKTDQSPPVLKYAQTARAGSYPISWKDSAGKEQTRLV